MAIESRNPATGELLASFEPLGARGARRAARARGDGVLVVEADVVRRARAAAASRRRTCSKRTPTALARLMTLEMGKLAAAPPRDEVLKCGARLPLLRRARRGVSRRRRHPDRSDAQLHPLRADGPVFAIMPWNFPVLAGVPLRRAGADGRQRRAAEARAERAAVRAGDRGALHARRLSRRACFRRS